MATHHLQYGSKYYVYFLINPITNKIFYIGKGKGKRAEAHLKESLSGRIINYKKHRVINSILKTGLKPAIFIFKNELSEREAFSIEANLIYQHHSTITNSQGGVMDKHEKNIILAQDMLARAMPYRKWLTIKERSLEHIEMYKHIYRQLKKLVSGQVKWYDTILIKNGVMEVY